MILGIMQPYFFPYLGHFGLIRRTDRWVAFDVVQYMRHGWLNRNRILHPTEGWQYIVVPLRRHGRDTLIRDIEVDDRTDWRRRILGQLDHYRRRAPHFAATRALVAECLAARESSLARLNVSILRRICDHLGLPLRCDILSEMNLALPPIAHPGEWALEIADRLGARAYVNPAGGAALFDTARFAARGIDLLLHETVDMPCDRRGREAIAGLSIVDVLMWNAPDEVRAFLDAQVRVPARAARDAVFSGVHA